jgi:hypothetical protein
MCPPAHSVALFKLLILLKFGPRPDRAFVPCTITTVAFLQGVQESHIVKIDER